MEVRHPMSPQCLVLSPSPSQADLLRSMLISCPGFYCAKAGQGFQFFVFVNFMCIPIY